MEVINILNKIELEKLKTGNKFKLNIELTNLSGDFVQLFKNDVHKAEQLRFNILKKALNELSIYLIEFEKFHRYFNYEKIKSNNDQNINSKLTTEIILKILSKVLENKNYLEDLIFRLNNLLEENFHDINLDSEIKDLLPIQTLKDEIEYKLSSFLCSPENSDLLKKVESNLIYKEMNLELFKKTQVYKRMLQIIDWFVENISENYVSEIEVLEDRNGNQNELKAENIIYRLSSIIICLKDTQEQMIQKSNSLREIFDSKGSFYSESDLEA